MINKHPNKEIFCLLGIKWLNNPLAAEYLEFIEIDNVAGTFGRKLIKSLSDATDCVSKRIV